MSEVLIVAGGFIVLAVIFYLGVCVRWDDGRDLYKDSGVGDE